MNQNDNIGENGKLNEHLLNEDLPPAINQSEIEPKRGISDFVRQFVSHIKRRRAPVQPDPKQDRTKALVLLIGGIVGSILLFVGVFSTPPDKQTKSDRSRSLPNLGRKDPGETNRASAIPLLNVQPQSDGVGQNRLSANDIHNTSRTNIPDDQLNGDSSTASDSKFIPIPSRQRKEPSVREAFSTEPSFSNSDVVSRVKPISVQPDRPAPATISIATGLLQAKSSIVFVRSAISDGASNIPNRGPERVSVNDDSLILPPGSRLIGRLESAITSAIRAPVVVAIEYNYEKDGMLLIPAGTKAIGELQQVSANGYVGIAFHSLQMPDGRSEPIEAIATDLRNEPLKGKVSGTNGSRKFLTRTLTGVGTIAAYVVGGGGSGLGQTISGGTLLRDRIAGNIGSAGEQELASSAFSQNIVVTVPAQTRLSIVFQKAAVEKPRSEAVSTARSTAKSEMPTVQELRELMDLRREINQMYAESTISPTSKP